MKISEVRLLALLVLGRFKKYWSNPRVKQVALEIRDAIDDLFAADYEAEENRLKKV